MPARMTALTAMAMAGVVGACKHPVRNPSNLQEVVCCPDGVELNDKGECWANGVLKGVAHAPKVTQGPSANSGLGAFTRIGWLGDGNPAWGNLGGSHFVNVPPHFAGDIVSVPNWDVAPGATLEFACPAGIPSCTATVLIYECSPCATSRGGINGDLVAAGFQRTRCAPNFKTGVPGGVAHRMTAFVKTLAGGEVDEFTTTAPLHYAVVGLKLFGVDCLSETTQPTCENHPQCIWRRRAGGNDVCHLNPCIGTGPGVNQCTVCTTDEVFPRGGP